MDRINDILQKIGLGEKDIKVYLALIALGPSAIRKIAERVGINRGTTHIILKKLQAEGLVYYYHKEKHQHFAAEDPKVLENIISRKRKEIESIGDDLGKIIPAIHSLEGGSISRPVVKFYENYSGVRTILEDALDSVGKTGKREYAAYSSSAISPYLYHRGAFPGFTEKRIKMKIFVRTIASGPGGTTHGQDERRWLTKKEGSPTYTLIYSGKVAMISVGANDIPHGLIIEDEGIYKTQLAIFNALWESLD